MKVLVTGGAGYIGSAVVRMLIEEGHEVTVIDNLSKGQQKLVDKKAVFIHCDLTDARLMERVFSVNPFDAVMHFSSYKAAGESMTNPVKYSDNIVGMINLLNCMVRSRIGKLIFSSSAAVYGEPVYTPIDEQHTLIPLNYYGFTKLACENIIDWYSRLRGITGICLRYFNVAGDCGLHYVDDDAQNVFPILMEVLKGRRDKFIVFGRDYDTPDGTCIRDYVDINDLARAHVLALQLGQSEKINLGTGIGISVMELLDMFSDVAGKRIGHEIGSRREGDPAKMTASFQKAKSLLGWEPKKDVKEMVKSTISAYEMNKYIPGSFL